MTTPSVAAQADPNILYTSKKTEVGTVEFFSKFTGIFYEENNTVTPVHLYLTNGGTLDLSRVAMPSEGNYIRASGYGNTIIGSAQGDRIIGIGDSADVFSGGAGDDNIFGNAGNDIIDGGTGNDELDGGLGDDTLYGGAGDDTLTGGSGSDRLVAGSGVDTLYGYGDTADPDDVDTAVLDGKYADYRLTEETPWFVRFSGADGIKDLYGIELVEFADGTLNLATKVFEPKVAGQTVTGTAGNDTISPTAGPAGQPRPGAGADTIYGLGGNDRIDGGAGADRMYGGAGNDTYYVDDAGDRAVEARADGTDEGGIDTVIASVTFDLGQYVENLTLAGTGDIDGTGNALDNVMTGNGGDNNLQGGEGNDTLFGNAGDDVLVGGDGNDRLYGGAGSDILAGGEGNDSLYGDMSDILMGGAGNDLLVGGIEMHGGAGNDIYVIDNPAVGIIETDDNGNDAGGIDTVQTSGSFVLRDFVENLVLTGGESIDGWGNALNNRITGNGNSNFIYGEEGNDLLFGNGGNDILDGGAGNDSLNGGTGADLMRGGAGNDIYAVDDAGDVVSEYQEGWTDAGGLDQVNASISYALGDFVENLVLTGSSAIDGTGNGLGNVIFGSAGANVLAGRGGNDVLAGKGGSDTFAFAEMGRANRDTIQDFGADDRIRLDTTVFAGLDGDGDGTLDLSAFVLGARATGAGPQIVYNAQSGMLSYDADGAGAGAAQEIALIGRNLAFFGQDDILVA